MDEPFKICPKCSHQWHTREDFLSDPGLVIIGFMANLDEFGKGSYLFNHILPRNKCNGTLGVYVEDFMDLYEGPLYEDLHYGTEECFGHCARVDDLQRCKVKCRNAVAREIVQILIEKLSANKKGQKG